MKAEVNVVVVGRKDGVMKALAASEPKMEFEFDLARDSAVELIRRNFRVKWGAEVHGIGNSREEDLGWDGGKGFGWIFMYADVLGELESWEWRVPAGGVSIWERAAQAAIQASEVQPWSRPRWLEETRLSLSRVVGFIEKEDLRQIRTGPTGAVLEFVAEGGRYFFKAVPECFSYEPKLLEYLSKKAPAVCPVVLPCRGIPRGYITEMVPGCSVLEIQEVGAWFSALRDLAEFQCKASEYVEDLNGIGVPLRRFSSFAARPDELVCEVVEAQRGVSRELSIDELRALDGILKRVKEECELLVSCGIPDSVIHGDLNDSNVYRTETGSTKLIDWTFAGVGHPFLTIVILLFEAEQNEGYLGGKCRELARAYLEPFERYCCRKQLEQGLRIARKLMWLYLAESRLSFYQLVRSEMPSGMGGVPRMMRRFMKDFTAV